MWSKEHKHVILRHSVILIPCSIWWNFIVDCFHCVCDFLITSIYWPKLFLNFEMNNFSRGYELAYVVPCDTFNGSMKWSKIILFTAISLPLLCSTIHVHNWSMFVQHSEKIWYSQNVKQLVLDTMNVTSHYKFLLTMKHIDTTPLKAT